MTQASMQAYLNIEPHLKPLQAFTLGFFGEAGERGLTNNELEVKANRDLHQRVSELHRMGLVVETGERRGGQTAYKRGDGIPRALRARSGRRGFSTGEVLDAAMASDGSGIIVRVLIPVLADAGHIAKSGVRVTLHTVSPC